MEKNSLDALLLFKQKLEKFLQLFHQFFQMHSQFAAIMCQTYFYKHKIYN